MAIYDNQTITDAWAGTGELDFPQAPGEELHALTPVCTGAGFYFTLSYSVTDLRTLQ
jgi:acetoacetate decarboxylase